MRKDEKQREETPALREALAERVRHTEGGRTARITEDPRYEESPGDLGHIASGMNGGSTTPSNRYHVKIVKARPSTLIGQARDYKMLKIALSTS